MKLFLDTNVMIDDIGKRGEGAAKVKLLHIAKMFGDISLHVSAKSYTDVFYVVNKHVDSAEVQQEFLDSLEIYNVCPIDAQDIAAACKFNWSDFEDALIMTAAQKVGADFLVTNDAAFLSGDASLSNRHVPTITPQGFLDMMREHGITYSVVDAR